MLLLTTIFFIMGVGEWLFPKFIGKLPLRLYGLVDENLRVLAQNSKKTQFPKEYIAITGDSYAVGVGDWLTETQRGSFLNSSAYSPAHLIHEKTGIDVVSFGRAGAGSFDGIWSEPVSQFLYINSVRDYGLSPPKYLLIFFYEGNDIYDNIEFLRDNLAAVVEKLPEQIELKKIQGFLSAEFEKKMNKNFNNSLWGNMIFTRFLFQGTVNLVKELFLLNKNSKKNNPLHKVLSKGEVNTGLINGEKVRFNVALMNGEKIGLPTHLQAPPQFGLTRYEKKLGLKDKLIEISVYIFDESIARLTGFFPSIKNWNIVFIPSPVSSYNMVSSHIHYRGFMQDVDVGKTAVVEEKHIKLCKTIKQIATNHNFSFINITKSIRLAASVEFLHGPLDWDHFNKRGYQVLSDDLVKLFLQPEEKVRMDNCEY